MSLFRRRPDGRAAAERGPLCACGTPLDLVDMDYGFTLPDAVFALPADELRARARGLDKVFVLDSSRGFVRTLLPVRLDHGSVTFGIWLEVPEEQARTAIAVWHEPEYASLSFAGHVANVLPPWDDTSSGARAEARPTSPDALPVVHDGDAAVRSLLHGTWPRADVVAALPGLEHAHEPS